MITFNATRNLLAVSLLAVGASLGTSSTLAAADPATAEIEVLLKDYERALNASDVAGLAELYTDDGVFMAQHRSPAVGRTAVRAMYEELLGIIDLDITFQVDEVVRVSPTLAYARTRSTGTTTVISNGQESSEGNQELFILARSAADGPWRISRYIFSSTQPRPGPVNPYGSYDAVLDSVLENALPIDPAVGYLTKEIGGGVYVITEGIYQSAFVVTGAGVVVLDAPGSYGAKLRQAIAEVTDEPIRMLVYSHTHKDHIGGAGALADIPDLQIVALDSVRHFLEEKKDPNRPVPNVTFEKEKTISLGGKEIKLRQHRNYHSDEGDLFIHIPEAQFLMVVDTLAPGYVPFMDFDLTSNFHEYLKVFDDILAYDFDVFVGGHLTQLGDRSHVEETKAYATDVYQTVKRVHAGTDLMTVMVQTAEVAGSFDNKYLLFKAFLETVTAKSAEEIKSRWRHKLAGVDVFVESHVSTALVYVRWDD